jgi:hypothetical protein
VLVRSKSTGVSQPFKTIDVEWMGCACLVEVPEASSVPKPECATSARRDRLDWISAQIGWPLQVVTLQSGRCARSSRGLPSHLTPKAKAKPSDAPASLHSFASKTPIDKPSLVTANLLLRLVYHQIFNSHFIRDLLLLICFCRPEYTHRCRLRSVAFPQNKPPGWDYRKSFRLI